MNCIVDERTHEVRRNTNISTCPPELNATGIGCRRRLHLEGCALLWGGGGEGGGPGGGCGVVKWRARLRQVSRVGM